MKAPSNNFAKNILLKWNIQTDVQFVRGVENFVYRTNDSSKYLRLTLPSHRKKREIEAELKWMDTLSKNNVRIVQPLLSNESQFVEEFIYNDQVVFATLFKAAPGRTPEKPEDYNPTFLKNWGAYIGNLHKYSSISPLNSRLSWDTEPGFILAETALINNKNHCYDIYQQLKSYLQSLPKDSSCYGLVHADLHQGNFFITEDYKITAFDFDDCQYHWHIYDLAVVMVSLKSMFKQKQWSLDHKACFSYVLEGYRLTHNLTPLWEERITAFTYWRNALLYFWAKARIEGDQILSEDLPRVTKMIEEISLSLQSFSPALLI